MSPVLHLLAPAGFEDPERPSGGNLYDRRIRAGLAEAGWEVRTGAVPGTWPRPDPDAFAALDRALAAVPDREPVLLDGLIASPAPAVLLPHARRIQLMILMHMPLIEVTGMRAAEEAVLTAAAGVITTSAWTREQLLAHYPLRPDLVRIARPGADPAPLAAGTRNGGSLLCVATVAPHKGQDLLLAALLQLRNRNWRCVCAGSLQQEPAFAAGLRRQVAAAGLTGRVDFPGVLTGAALDAAYANADVLLTPSRSETYGMVVTEALARGLPVLAADVGGLPEALGLAPDGTRPGRLIRPQDPDALGAAVRTWLEDPGERDRLRAVARHRRAGLHGWDRTVTDIGAALDHFAGVPAER